MSSYNSKIKVGPDSTQVPNNLSFVIIGLTYALTKIQYFDMYECSNYSTLYTRIFSVTYLPKTTTTEEGCLMQTSSSRRHSPIHIHEGVYTRNTVINVSSHSQRLAEKKENR